MSTLSVAALTELAVSVLVASGVAARDARTCAVCLVEGDLRGQRAHGLSRLPAYVRRIDAGGLDPSASPRVVRHSAVSALIDGGNGLGPVVMSMATETAIVKAKESGMAWVGAFRSNHAGAGGVYVQRVVDAGLIGIFGAVANSNQLAPWGGVEALLGPNPIAIGIPAGDEPSVILDMATTTVSFGTVRQRAASGQPLPEGWLMDRDGAPVTDPRSLTGATLVPIGGYKGYGLSLAIAALAGTLNGARWGSDLVDHYEDQVTPTNTGQFIFALDPGLFRDRPAFERDLDVRLREIRASRPMKSVDRVLIPGERSADRRSRTLGEGIEIADQLLNELRQLARPKSVEDPRSHPGRLIQ